MIEEMMRTQARTMAKELDASRHNYDELNLKFDAVCQHLDKVSRENLELRKQVWQQSPM